MNTKAIAEWYALQPVETRIALLKELRNVPVSGVRHLLENLTDTQRAGLAELQAGMSPEVKEQVKMELLGFKSFEDTMQELFSGTAGVPIPDETPIAEMSADERKLKSLGFPTFDETMRTLGIK